MVPLIMRPICLGELHQMSCWHLSKVGQSRVVTRWHHTFIVTGKSEQQQEIFHMVVCVCLCVCVSVLVPAFWLSKLEKTFCTVNLEHQQDYCWVFFAKWKEFKTGNEFVSVHWLNQTAPKLFLFQQEMIGKRRSRWEREHWGRIHWTVLFFSVTQDEGKRFNTS